MRKYKKARQKRLILTILLQREAKKYTLTREQAEGLLRVIQSYYGKGNRLTEG